MLRDVDGPALAKSVGRVRSPPLPPLPPTPPLGLPPDKVSIKKGGIRGGSHRGPASGLRSVAVGGPGAVRAPCPRPRLRGVRWPALDMSGFRRGSARGLSQSGSVSAFCRRWLLPPRVGLPARPPSFVGSSGARRGAPGRPAAGRGSASALLRRPSPLPPPLWGLRCWRAPGGLGFPALRGRLRGWARGGRPAGRPDPAPPPALNFSSALPVW